MLTAPPTLQSPLDRKALPQEHFLFAEKVYEIAKEGKQISLMFNALYVGMHTIVCMHEAYYLVFDTGALAVF